jgi:nitrate reductase delta subunit
MDDGRAVKHDLDNPLGLHRDTIATARRFEPRQLLDKQIDAWTGFRSSHRSPDHVAALDRVRGWTRERFKLADEDVVMVAEVACGLPGCPPVETVVAFWTGDRPDQRRYQFKVFKPVNEVVNEDLPFAWLKASLESSDGFAGDCC